MSLNLDDNKKPYFKQLGLDDTFDEIQNAFNTLEGQVPSSGSSLTVSAVTFSSQPATDTSTASTVNVLTVDSNGTIKKKAKSNTKVYRALFNQSGTSAPTVTVLENTFGGNIVWTRAGAGWYVGTLSGAFTANKTIVNGQTKFTGNGTTLGVLGNLSGTLYYTYFDMFGEPNAINFYIYDSAFAGNVEYSTAMGSSPYYIEVISY